MSFFNIVRLNNTFAESGMQVIQLQTNEKDKAATQVAALQTRSDEQGGGSGAMARNLGLSN